MALRRVVVTGLGALTPIGNTAAEFWQGLVNGKSGAAPITRFDAGKFRTKFACEVKNFNAEDHFDRKEARKMDPFTQYALVVADEAIKDSTLDLEKINRDRAGVIWGSGIGGLKTFQDEVRSYTLGDGTPRFNPFFIPKMIADISAGYISIKYGFRGPNFVTVSACASATNAIIDALNYIRLGHMDIAMSGGSEAAVTEAGMGGFNAMKALSERNDSPETASRPFDKNRDGFVVGEGAGTLILESLDSAKKRDAKIYAEIVGGGESSDAYHITGTHPEGLGAYLAMESAIKEANVSPEKIEYINAHATSTSLGDLSEINAIEKLFKPYLAKLQVSASKSMTGHLLGGTGAIEAISTCLSLSTGSIPPTINTAEVDEKINKKLNLSLHGKTTKEINYALSNSFGFGGHCAALVLKKY